jgi:hypothetical protein
MAAFWVIALAQTATSIAGRIKGLAKNSPQMLLIIIAVNTG